ncbi:MAG: pantoate--beta-alanine ligase [Thermaerobacter sp.]|nr:pantoate--beta-alanine ligase [Thermaerobacter sp.]
MLQYTTIQGLREAMRSARKAGKSLGLVPTMGYLHAGHIAICETARRECDLVVVSIFVNPLQFAPSEDLESYPRDLDRDLGILSQTGVDAVFTPSVEEMYPETMETWVSVPSLSQTLEGKSRPTHFQGVATVVLKLFSIVQPDIAYFGQKDGQQVAVVRRMVRDLQLPLEVHVVPTVRETDGLAMSSRNVYLDPPARASALALSRALFAGRALLEAGERRGAAVQQAMEAVLTGDSAVRMDYAAVVQADSLVPQDRVQGRTMLAVAAYVGRARLLDNLMLDVGPSGVRDLLTPS